MASTQLRMQLSIKGHGQGARKVLLWGHAGFVFNSRTSTERSLANAIGTPRAQSESPNSPRSLPARTECALYRPGGMSGSFTRASAAFDWLRNRQRTPLPLRDRRANPSQAAGVVCCQLPSGKKLSLILVLLRRFLNHAIFSCHQRRSAVLSRRKSPSRTGADPSAV